MRCGPTERAFDPRSVRGYNAGATSEAHPNPKGRMFHMTDLLRRGALLSLSLILGIILAACSGGGTVDESGAAGGGTVAVADGAVEVSAADFAFDASTIEASAGEAFTITFTNKDDQPHNIAIYAEKDGEQIFVGDIITGPGETIDNSIPALDAGEYYFQCDVHSDMNGSIVVT